MRTHEQSTAALSFLRKPFGSTSQSIGLYDQFVNADAADLRRLRQHKKHTRDNRPDQLVIPR
jgi:hypothetical protein